jgi:acyl-CoA reductase-like NAD-dependent aldehyde dehydrogenase
MTLGIGTNLSFGGPSTGAPVVSPQTEPAALDAAIQRLSDQARNFARLGPRVKAALLREVRRRFGELAGHMVEVGNRHKRVDASSSAAGEEWFSGPAISLRALRLFEGALEDIARSGAPRLGANAVELGARGEARVTLVPNGIADHLLFPGWSCRAWLEPSVSAGRVAESQAAFYHRRDPEGHVVLVLGAGNVASISVLDVLHHSFVEGGVCLLKMSPVNAYLGPLFERAFAPLIERGFFAVVQGGAEAGAYLAAHPGIDAIHVTGSIETHDRIVWGPPGPERERRRRENEPLTTKKITSELGNVSPVLVVPAKYSERELDAAARSIAGMMVHNDSFNCNAARAVLTARSWPQREELLQRLVAVLAATPTRFAYYPGATPRFEKLLSDIPEALVRRLGEAAPEKLPWTLVSGLEASSNAALFRTEAFCPILTETPLDAHEAPEFLRLATNFANERLAGTLNVMLIAPDSLLRDPLCANAVELAKTELRYGTVSVNLWPAVSYGLGAPLWGGYPGATIQDAQSGIGWGHNAFMLEHVEKVVLEGPLLGFPRPFWFPGHAHLSSLGRGLTDFEADPGPEPLLRAGFAALWP